LRHLTFLKHILARAGNADILMALDPVTVGLPALLACDLLRLPFVLRIGGDYAWEQGVQRFGVKEDLQEFLVSSYGWRVELLKRIEGWVARRAIKVIVPSHFMQTVIEQWGVRTDRIAVIGNAFDESDAAGLPASREEARARLHIEGRLVVSMGRLLRLKGFEKLIEAVSSLRPEFPDLRLAILGSGPQSAELRSRLRQARLEGIVQLVGALPHPNALLYLKAADLFVLNSATEGMAHAIVEAMALGTPVIATRAGGNPELVDHGRSGWLVTHDDGPALEEVIRELLRDPARAASLAEVASQSLGRFDIAPMVRQTVAVMDSVA
jgi:glycosyltransferase involved in cell wall biosynthesis